MNTHFKETVHPKLEKHISTSALQMSAFSRNIMGLSIVNLSYRVRCMIPSLQNLTSHTKNN